jgi:hypothetical protein
MLGACAGSRRGVRFDQLRYPVSASAYLYAPASVTQLVKVDDFRAEARLWGIFYSLIPLGGDLDVSATINKLVAKAGGDGVVDLTVRAESCGINYVFPLTLLPVWPGCTLVRVEGSVVRALRAPPPGAQ